MTSPLAPPPQAVPQVTPVPGSRLEQLLQMREPARTARDEAQSRLEAIEAGIKSEAAGACPGAAVIDIPAGPHRPGLRLRYHAGGWHVPAETLRKKYAQVWEELKQQKRGSWQLHKLEDGGAGR